MTTSDAITKIDTEIARLQAARAVLIELTNGKPVTKLRLATERRSPLNGTRRIVMDAVIEGKHTLTEIAEATKIKTSTARTAILALEASGHIHRDGKGSRTRYVPKAA